MHNVILTYLGRLFNKILLIFMPGFSLDFGAYSLLAFKRDTIMEI
jgi:hypothetical protein